MADLRQVFNRNVTLSYMVNNPIKQTKFWQSGAFVSDARLRQLLTSGSQTFTVPFINPIDSDLEPNYGNTVFTDLAMPRGIEGYSSQGRAAYVNEGVLESRLQAHLTGVSPLQAIAGMLDQFWIGQAENRAIATLIGIRNYDQANGKALTTDISKATATAASGFDVNAFIDAEGTLEEAYQGTGLLIVHPLIATKMRKQNLVEKVTTSADLPPVETYNGRRVVQSKRGTVIGKGANAQYVSSIIGAGAIAADMVAGNDDLEIERTAATGNGSGHTTLWTRRDLLIHPQGFSFVADPATLTGGTKNEAISASWEDLTKAANWRLDASADNLAIRFLVTNL